MAGANGLFTIVIMVGIFYFFLIKPEQNKQKKVKEMMQGLKVGDVVFTRGGIQGTIVNIEEDIVTLATGPDRVKINVSRQGIGSVVESAPVVEDTTESLTEGESQDQISLEKKNEESEQ